MHSSLQNLVALSTDINGDRGLPVASYSDPDWLAKEREAILDKGWYYIGLTHNLANPGDVIVGHAGRVPVLVSRKKRRNPSCGCERVSASRLSCLSKRRQPQCP